MIRLSLLVVSILFFIKNTTAQTEFYGIFKNESVYILNPKDTISKKYCIDSIFFNRKPYKTDLKSDRVTVDFSGKNIMENKAVVIEIYHKPDCLPMILNPESFYPKSTCEIPAVNLITDTLVWKTINERGTLNFEIEQYRWNTWKTVATVQGLGTPDTNTYKYNVEFHTGVNRFRVKQTDYSQVARFSDEIIFTSSEPPVQFSPGDGETVSRYIEFSAVTDYEVFDFYGEFLFSGRANRIDVYALNPGTYFLKFDNNMVSFIRR